MQVLHAGTKAQKHGHDSVWTHTATTNDDEASTDTKMGTIGDCSLYILVDMDLIGSP